MINPHAKYMRGKHAAVSSRPAWQPVAMQYALWFLALAVLFAGNGWLS